jgi:acyl-coenzyme A thioesterase PaaI-like protein
MNFLDLWRRVSGLPNGKRIFSFLLARKVPYTGSIGAVVQELGPGRAVVEMRDRRAVRNHLDSIHAVALMNLAEVTSGLALIGALPDSMRGIVTNFSIEFFKKGRGKLTGRCECQIPESKEQKPYDIPVDVFNAEGERVCRATARWLIGPKKK